MPLSFSRPDSQIWFSDLVNNAIFHRRTKQAHPLGTTQIFMQTIILCTNFRPFSGQPSCAFRGSEELASFLEAEIECRGLDVQVERSVCLGHCVNGPNVRLLGGPFIHHADKEKLNLLLSELESNHHPDKT